MFLFLFITKQGVDKKGNMQYNVSWKRIGKANSMEEARKFTKHPVLEEVR